MISLLLLAACTGTTDTPDDTVDTVDTVDTEDSGDPGDGKQRFVILHTNDWQSHMTGWGPNAEYTPETTGDDETVGGLARTRTLIDRIRASTDDQVLLFDGGDWM